MTLTYDESLDLVRSLSDAEWAELAGRLLTTRFPTARPDQQRPDGDWKVWLLMAGRGFGKTRVGAEEIADQALTHPGDYFVCAPTHDDMRSICIEGAGSGLLHVLRRRAVDYDWNISTRFVTLPNGSKIKCGGADEPDRWRGYNFSGGWADELASWRRPDTFDQLRFCTRLGDARIVATTTPRPTALMRALVADPTTHLTRGRTLDNVENLSAAAVADLQAKYGGTRQGRQELEGELLLDTPGALVRLEDIDHVEDHPDLDRISTAIDPAVTSHEESDESGVVTVGRAVPAGDDRFHLYVLADDSGRYSPEGTGRVAVDAHHAAEGDGIVGEVNNGGDYIGSVIRQIDPTVPYRAVRASRGKAVRAEPLAALYEQGRVHHVGVFAELERQLCEWSPDAGWSPDRLDALVWAAADLSESGRRRGARVVVRAA